MNEPQSLQFDRAEYESSSAATTCASCKQPIIQSYYAVNGQLMCSRCHEALTQGNESGRTARIGRAVAAGFGVALVGALVWWGVRKLTGYEIGLISVAIGVGVGKAVRWGSRARGGWAYQLLAILLTYTAVAVNYMPDVVQEFIEQAKKEQPAAVATTTQHVAAQKASVVPAKDDDSPGIGATILALVVVFGIAAAAPFLAGANNIIGLLIIGFGLFEAWKINKRVPLTISGPFSVAPAAPPNV